MKVSEEWSGEMRRIGLLAFAGFLLLGTIAWILPGSGEAQDSTGDRLNALETKVATQAGDISSLKKRVKALEQAKSGSSNASDAVAPSAAGNPVTLNGTGPTVTDKFSLKSGRYKITVTVDVANFDGFSLYIYPPSGSKDLVLNELIDHAGLWKGSAVFEASSDGDYYAETQNTSSAWTVMIEAI